MKLSGVIAQAAQAVKAEVTRRVVNGLLAVLGRAK